MGMIVWIECGLLIRDIFESVDIVWSGIVLLGWLLRTHLILLTIHY